MNLKLYSEDISEAAREGILQSLKQWYRKHLEPLLEPAGMNHCSVAVTVNRLHRGASPYTVKLRCHLPRRKILVASGQADDLKAALNEAQDRLVRSVKTHLDRLRRQSLYKRKARRQRLRELKARLVEMASATGDTVQDELEPLLPQLRRVVARELEYFRSCGEITGDYPAVEDVLDETVAAVRTRGRADESRERLWQRMLREAFAVLDREVAAGRQYGAMLSLEEEVPADAQDQAEAMVEEDLYEYYQPDEILSLEDVIADESASLPESEDEVQRLYALDTLRHLPVLWRRALLLFEFENMVPAEIAAVLGVETVTAERWIRQANEFVCSHLEQAGFSGVVERPLARAEGGKEHHGH